MRKTRKRRQARRLIELPDDRSFTFDPAGSTIVGVETIPVVTTSESVFLKKRVRRVKNDCCNQVTPPLEVRILAVEESADFSTLIVDAVAIHLCGITFVSAYIADLVFDFPDLKFLRRRIVPRLVNGQRIEDGADFDCDEVLRAVAPRFRIPTANITGTPFRVAVEAINCCFDYNTALSNRRLIL